jgi:hypothetical protein
VAAAAKIAEIAGSSPGEDSTSRVSRRTRSSMPPGLAPRGSCQRPPSVILSRLRVLRAWPGDRLCAAAHAIAESG